MDQLLGSRQKRIRLAGSSEGVAPHAHRGVVGAHNILRGMKLNCLITWMSVHMHWQHTRMGSGIVTLCTFVGFTVIVPHHMPFQVARISCGICAFAAGIFPFFHYTNWNMHILLKFWIQDVPNIRMSAIWQKRTGGFSQKRTGGFSIEMITMRKRISSKPRFQLNQVCYSHMLSQCGIKAKCLTLAPEILGLNLAQTTWFFLRCGNYSALLVVPVHWNAY